MSEQKHFSDDVKRPYIHEDRIFSSIANFQWAIALSSTTRILRDTAEHLTQWIGRE